jgi:hypothetical protein
VLAAERKGVVDLIMRREKPQRLTGGFEPLHLPFASSCRLVRDFRPAVAVAALAALDPRHDLAFGGAIAAQLVRHDHTGHVLQAFQPLLEDALGRLGAKSRAAAVNS